MVENIGSSPDIVGTASFSALSAGLTSGINLDTFGGSLEGVDWAHQLLFEVAGFGSHLTLEGIGQLNGEKIVGNITIYLP